METASAFASARMSATSLPGTPMSSRLIFGFIDRRAVRLERNAGGFQHGFAACAL